jgi:hypothetical protein
MSLSLPWARDHGPGNTGHVTLQLDILAEDARSMSESVGHSACGTGACLHTPER